MRFASSLVAITLLVGSPLVARAGSNNDVSTKLSPTIGLIHGADQAEIEDATLAIAHLKAGAVKDFAQMLRDDHTAADHELQTIVDNLGVAMSGLEALGDEGATMQQEHRQFLSSVATLDASAFAVAFLRHERDDHQKVIAKLTTLRAALPEDADTAALAAFVDKTLPKLEEHRQRAETLLAQIGG